MEKFYCIVPSKAKYVTRDNPYTPVSKPTVKTIYAEDKEQAKLFCKAKYGIEPTEVYSKEELLKKDNEDNGNDE